MKKAERHGSISICSKELMDAIVVGNKKAVALFVDEMMQSLTDIMKDRPKLKAVDYVIRIEARSVKARKEDEAKAWTFFQGTKRRHESATVKS